MLKKYSFLFLSLLIIWTPLSLIALGYKFNLLLLTANYYLLFLCLYLILRKYFAIIFFLHSLVCSLYLPVGLTWGELNVGMMESILRTNVQESIEFVSQFPVKYLIYAGLFFIFSCSLTYLCWKNKTLNKLKINRLFLSFNVLAIFIFLAKIFIEPFIFDDYKPNFELISKNPYTKFYTLILEKYEEVRNLKTALNYKDNFEVIETKPKYKNYFLVIGESMRNDYTSLYGYPIDTTPFLRQVKGKVYDGFVVPSANTPSSLSRILFWDKSGEKYKSYNYYGHNTGIRLDVLANNELKQYEKNKKLEKVRVKFFENIINLAKKANYKTIWISNHGQRGNADIATTAIAKINDDYFFTLKGSWAINVGKQNVFDKNLLPILKEKINSNKDNNIKLYTLHIIGSHEPFCERLEKGEKLIYRTPNERFSCYLHSLTKTDKFLANLEQLLKQELKEDYSVLYFSDHGVSHMDKTYQLRHFTGFQQDYESPLVIFNGDDTEQQRIKVKKSGYNFIFAFAEWLGIREKNLEAENYTFFNNEDDKNIKVFNWDKDVDFDSLPRDIRFVDNVEKLEP